MSDTYKTSKIYFKLDVIRIKKSLLKMVKKKRKINIRSMTRINQENIPRDSNEEGSK